MLPRRAHQGSMTLTSIPGRALAVWAKSTWCPTARIESASLRKRSEVRGWHRRDAMLWLGIALNVNLLLACANQHDAAWRHDQELRIAEVVLLDLAEKPSQGP